MRSKNFRRRKLDDDDEEEKDEEVILKKLAEIRNSILRVNRVPCDDYLVNAVWRHKQFMTKIN
jgi:hypothetical protein